MFRSLTRDEEILLWDEKLTFSAGKYDLLYKVKDSIFLCSADNGISYHPNAYYGYMKHLVNYVLPNTSSVRFI